MDALLILSGSIALLLGWGWLTARSARLGRTRLLLAIMLPIATLLMPRRGYPLLPRVLIAAGLLLLLVGVGDLYQRDRDRFDLLLSGTWLDLNQPERALQGEIAGQRFLPDRVLWRDNQLVFEEGPVERVRRSLAIRFDGAETLLNDLVVHRTPSEGAPWPELILQWYEGALQDPGLHTSVGPYSLTLRLMPSSNGRVPLFINLALPEEQDTWLRGEGELRTPPPWVAALEASRAPPQAQAKTRSAVPSITPDPSSPSWGELSLLALLDEPGPFIGLSVRVTTLSGRLHEGQFKGVTDDRRIVLGQQRGASAVDFQFNPADVVQVEILSVR